jgi:hypothetical protein
MSKASVFVVKERTEDDDHAWAVICLSCDLSNDGDPLLAATVTTLRNAYGEEELLSQLPPPDPGANELFDMEALVKGFRKGLPSSAAEGKKPAALTNYRSEPAEMVARQGLAAAHAVVFRSDPQRGKTQPNQPILGFDNWGLVSVKGTDEDDCPPRVCDALIDECGSAPLAHESIARALSVLALRLKGTPEQKAILEMLEKLGNDQLPQIYVAPVVVRGGRQAALAALADLSSLRAAANAKRFHPAKARGLAVSVGAELGGFGRRVVDLARSVS